MDNMKNATMVFILFAVSTNPVHSIVINAGGSLGQQTMYSLAIAIPVLIAGYFISSESLKSIQWLGILLAVIGTVLMNSKAH